MDYIKAAAACTRDEDPACTVACPFHLDIRTLITRLRAGRFDSAYRLLRDAMVFPETALRLCPAPCEAVCERNAVDKAVSLLRLERAALQYTKKKEALRLNVPPKAQRVAVIGAGLSGLACASRFSARGYPVTVYERTDRLGGSLWERFPDGSFMEEIRLQMDGLGCVFRMSAEVKDLGDIDADAIYVATGSGGNDFGVLRHSGSGVADKKAVGAARDEAEGLAGFADGADGKTGVFFGGGLCGAQGAFALSQGIDITNRIEGFLKTGLMPPDPGQARRPVNKPNPDLLVYTAPVEPSGEHYTAEEAALEAARCIQCNCDTCARRCPLVRHYRRYPDRIAEETEGTVRPTDIINNRLATRLVASCNQCGLCAEDCPQGVDLRAILADAKREMKAKGEMPEAFSGFWLDEMAHAQETSFVVQPEGVDTCGYLFFPGCRLGAADPAYVTETYKRLRERYPDMALLTDCCGAPAYWAGDMRLYQENVGRLRCKWEKLGCPVPVCACPTCAAMLKDALPGCEPVSLYSLDFGAAAGAPTRAPEGVPAEIPASDDSGGGHTAIVSVFDPCAARFDSAAQDGVRRILEAAGITLQPLAHEREDTICCGWGGQYHIANPAMAEEAVTRTASLADTVYVTYCVNCRETLVDAGKPALHILDVLLGIGDPGRKPPTHTRRRENRMALLQAMTGVSFAVAEGVPALYMDDSLREKLSKDRILEKETLEAILYCEQSKRKLVHSETGAFAGYSRRGRLTCWVEYKPEGAGYRLLNAYAHSTVIDE